MAKIKATITGGGVNHQKAYDRIRHSESLAGTTRDGSTVHVQTNCRPLNAMVEKDSLIVQHDVYDWNTGMFGDVRGDVLKNAQRHAARLKTHSETSQRQREQKEIDCKSGSGVASVPTLGRRY